MTSRSSVGPLSVGNVVTTAFSLYKSNFMTYAKLAGIALLWSLVPVYGWAKAAMYHGVISRMAFGLLSNQPETSVEARRAIQERFWLFLVARLLMGLVVGAIVFGLVIAFGILVGIAVAIGVGMGNAVGIVFASLLGLLALVGFLLGISWASSRFLVTEVPIAVEKECPNPDVALGRSWKLTQGFVLRLMAIVFVAGLVVWPIQMITNVGPRLLLQYVQIMEVDPVILVPAFVMLLVVATLGQVIVQPFWQILTAVVYYDLRARKEGADIQLRDRPI